MIIVSFFPFRLGYNDSMKKTLKNILKAALLIAAALVTVALVYALYVIITYSRIDDETELEVANNTTLTLRDNKEYTIVTYNVGFGAYSPSYSFFMDTSTWKSGKVTTGLYGKGLSRADVENNTEGSAAVLRDIDADFILLQEVDTPSTRSYGVDMKSYYEKTFPEMCSTFAVNFHSSWLNLPFWIPTESPMPDSLLSHITDVRRL